MADRRDPRGATASSGLGDAGVFRAEDTVRVLELSTLELVRRQVAFGRRRSLRRFLLVV